MSDFIYDQMVTAESLNGIAVDLGAGDFSVFTDSTPYAVGKLNDITAALVGSGISTALNRFELTVSTSGIVIGTGIAFFESGKKFKLTTPVTLSFQSGELYFYENLSTGEVSINIGTLPSNNYIHIATIYSDMTYTDRRLFAKAKVQLPAEGTSYSFIEQIIYSNGEFNKNTTAIPISGISKIFIRCLRNEYKASMYEYDVSTEKFTGGYMSGDDRGFAREASKIYIVFHNGTSSDLTYLSVQEQDEETVVFKYESGGNAGRELNVEFYVFGGLQND